MIVERFDMVVMFVSDADRSGGHKTIFNQKPRLFMN